jgi:hypothetical protein
MKLDWFLARGLDLAETAITPTFDSSGRPLSEHHPITTRILGFL